MEILLNFVVNFMFKTSDRMLCFLKIFYIFFYIATFSIASGCNVLKIVNQKDNQISSDFFYRHQSSIKIPEFNNKLIWLTHIGSQKTPHGNSNSGNEMCYGVVTDSSGNVYCSGHTTGSLGENNGGSDDAFIMKLNSSGELQWITQLGAITDGGGDTSQYDRCNDIAVDSQDNIYCACQTRSNLGETTGGNIDACIIKLNSNGDVVQIKTIRT